MVGVVLVPRCNSKVCMHTSHQSVLQPLCLGALRWDGAGVTAVVCIPNSTLFRGWCGSRR
jgi:hypothetical protein